MPHDSPPPRVANAERRPGLGKLICTNTSPHGTTIPTLVDQPDFVQSMRRDLSDWRQWMARIIVLASAVVAGLAVVAFTWLSEHALAAFNALRDVNPFIPCCGPRCARRPSSG